MPLTPELRITEVFFFRGGGWILLDSMNWVPVTDKILHSNVAARVGLDKQSLAPINRGNYRNYEPRH